VAFEGIEGGIIHRLREVAPDEVMVGLRVEAVLRPKDQREASVPDISHFRPAPALMGRKRWRRNR
jgi:uncharacterized OB-fold protein